MIMTNSPQADTKTKEERIRDYVRSIQAIEEAIQPYKEQKSDLRKSYVENNWLSKGEIKNVMKAYRLMKDETDFAELEHMYNKVTGV